MFDFVKNFLAGKNAGPTNSDIYNLTNRSRFSSYLPYMCFDEKNNIWINHDDTIGFIMECSPLVYASNRIFSDLQGLFRADIPLGSVLQFMLYADPNIDYYLDCFKSEKNMEDDAIRGSVNSFIDMFKDLSKGKGNKILSGNPIRNFRLFVSLKFKVDKNLSHKKMMGIRDSVYEIFRGAFLFPTFVEPEELINVLSKFFNSDSCPHLSYDETKSINEQIILSNTKIETSFSNIKINDRYLRCLTPKNLCNNIEDLTANFLTGGIWGTQSDTQQHQSPFLITVNCIFEDFKNYLHGKCNFILQQRGAGSLSASLNKMKEEYISATAKIDEGTVYTRIMPIMWIISDQDKLSENSARSKRIWEQNNFVMQEDVGILNIMLLSALPFGLFTGKNNYNIKSIARDFIVPEDVAVRFFPVQADFSGSSKPVSLLVGRKGQVVGCDIFDRSAPNHNVLVAGSSGSGKSFFVNTLLFNYYSQGAYIRIIDIGNSYKKLCEIVGGKYISFSQDSNIILNPFSNILNIEEDQNVIAAILVQMIYSYTQSDPRELEVSLIKEAVRAVYLKHGNKAEIDDVYTWLLEASKNEDRRKIASDLAENIKDFTSKGAYGKWFHGKSNLDISQDRFVVLELEDLKQQGELFKVIMLQLINYMTDNLYRSSINNEKIIVFDEAWQFLGDDSSKMMKNVIESGYRRARKYRGSFITITQGVMDIKRFGEVGGVVSDNSAFKFFLSTPDFGQARKEGIIDYDDFLMKILSSIRTVKPKYSEVFMQTPVATGVARVVVDPFSYYMYTSDPNDNVKINKLLMEGKTYVQAFHQLSSS